MRPMRRYIEVPVAGRIFAVVTGSVLLAAINSQTNLLFFFFGVLAGCLLLSAFLAERMVRHVEVTRQVVDHAAAGERIDVHYHLRNGKRFWPALAVAVGEIDARQQVLQVPEGYCGHAGPGQSATVMAHMIPRRRGLLELRAIRLASAFPFGFVNFIVQRPAVQTIVVYPRIGTLSRQVLLQARESATLGTITSASRGGQDEFYGLRPYRAGDPVRAIHWKRSARTGELVIRELTSNVTPQMVVVLDVRGWQQPGASRAEAALELAAAVIAHGFLENFAVGLLVVGAQWLPVAQPRMGVDQRRRLLGTLALLDLARIEPQMQSLPRSLRKSGAQWVVVSLTKTSALEIPSGGAVTLLALDDPQSTQWLTFPELSKPAAV